MSGYTTVFGSLDKYEKGRVEVINDNAKNYAFSNVFEICSKSKPYEKVVMGINQIMCWKRSAPRVVRLGTARHTTSSRCAWTVKWKSIW